MGASNRPRTFSGEKDFYRVRLFEKGGKKVALFVKGVTKEYKEANPEEEILSDTKDNKTYYYKTFDTLTGTIKRLLVWTDTSADDSKSWENLSIELFDNETNTTECLTIGFSSGECEDFLKRLPRINHTLPVKLCIYCIKSKGPGEYWNKYLVPYQNFSETEEGQKVESFFNKDNPLPDFKEVEVNGKKLKDKTDRLKKLKELVSDFTKKLDHQNEYTGAESESTGNTKTKNKK